jgi:hypothetical protein
LNPALGEANRARGVRRNLTRPENLPENIPQMHGFAIAARKIATGGKPAKDGTRHGVFFIGDRLPYLCVFFLSRIERR